MVLGRRHQGGGRPWLTGAVLQAALYDRALRRKFRVLPIWSFRISRSELLKSLTTARRSERDAALATPRIGAKGTR